MGNCLPFLHRRVGTDDFTRLENLSNDAASGVTSGSRRRSSHHRHGSAASSSSSNGASSSGDNRTSRRHRNLQASSYVNQLYMNSAFGPGNDESNAAENKVMDDKRKARIRGLLEQIPIDIFVEGVKGDTECAICMGDFQSGDPIRFLPCMHAYHLQCIDDWLLRSFTCPSCMEPVDSALLSAFTVNTTASTDLASLAGTTNSSLSTATKETQKNESEME